MTEGAPPTPPAGAEPPRAGLQRLVPRPYRRDAAEMLRAAILDGTLASGSPLVERRIAEEMGISRAPVREALRKLEEDGLVVTLPYKGTYVTRVTPRMVDEILSLRTVLEGFAAERALSRLLSPDAARLAELQAGMVAAARREDQDAIVELHMAFHRTFYEFADHELLLQFWNTMEGQLRLYDRVHQRTYASLDQYVAAHQRIVDVLPSGDPAVLRQALVGHITENVEQLLPRAHH